MIGITEDTKIKTFLNFGVNTSMMDGLSGIISFSTTGSYLELLKNSSIISVLKCGEGITDFVGTSIFIECGLEGTTRSFEN